MAIDTLAPRSRRSLLTGVAAGLAGVAAATLAGAQRVLAAGDDGTAIHVADIYDDVRNTTRLVNNTNNQPALRVGSNQGGDGISAFSHTGDALSGESDSRDGVYGHADTGTGVHGTQGNRRVPGLGRRHDPGLHGRGARHDRLAARLRGHQRLPAEHLRRAIR
jgi:hypothetical protein